MEVKAVSKSIKISPRKVRLVATSLSGLLAGEAINRLSLVRKRGALPIVKTIKSAIANAVHNDKLSAEALLIKRIDVSDGPSFKRFRPSTRGRVHPYKKRTSHIKVVLEEKK